MTVEWPGMSMRGNYLQPIFGLGLAQDRFIEGSGFFLALLTIVFRVDMMDMTGKPDLLEKKSP